MAARKGPKRLRANVRFGAKRSLQLYFRHEAGGPFSLYEFGESLLKPRGGTSSTKSLMPAACFSSFDQAEHRHCKTFCQLQGSEEVASATRCDVFVVNTWRDVRNSSGHRSEGLTSRCDCAWVCHDQAGNYREHRETVCDCSRVAHPDDVPCSASTRPHAHDVGATTRRLAVSAESSVENDEITSRRRNGFSSAASRAGLNQLKEPSRPGGKFAVLDITRRPEALGRSVVALVKKVSNALRTVWTLRSRCLVGWVAIVTPL